MTAGTVQGAWTCGLIAGAFGKVTDLQEGAWATWSRIRKGADGAGVVTDMQGLRGNRRKVSGVSRIGAKGVFSGAQERRGPLVYPPQGKCFEEALLGSSGSGFRPLPYVRDSGALSGPGLMGKEK